MCFRSFPRIFDIDYIPRMVYIFLIMEQIALCGDNCSECSRYLAKTEKEKKLVAELWHRIGWRDTIVSIDEISCDGCASHKKCAYDLLECVKEHGVEKCGCCPQFPCEKIESMLKRSAKYKAKCKVVCSNEEYAMLEKSFFRKEENLKKC